MGEVGSEVSKPLFRSFSVHTPGVRMPSRPIKTIKKILKPIRTILVNWSFRGVLLKHAPKFEKSFSTPGVKMKLKLDFSACETTVIKKTTK